MKGWKIRGAWAVADLARGAGRVGEGSPAKDGGRPAGLAPPGVYCGGCAPLAEVTLTPGGHGSLPGPVLQLGPNMSLKSGLPEGSAPKTRRKDARLCFSLKIIFRDGPQDLIVFSFNLHVFSFKTSLF